MRINFIATEEEKNTYIEAAYDAHMNMSEWIRQILNEAVNKYNAGYTNSIPSPGSVPICNSGKVITSIESLRRVGVLTTGKEVSLPTREIPKWADNDTEEIAYNRELLFGKNPLRMLSQREADFNKLSVVKNQKYNEDGTPRLNLSGDYIPVD